MKTKTSIQNDALEAIKPYKRVGVGMIMGTGKTLLGLKHMKIQMDNLLLTKTKKEIKFLIVAPKVSIFKTWKEEALNYGFNDLIDCCSFTTYLSLCKQSLDYDCVYLDECHNLKFSHDVWLSQYQNNTLGMTGTPPQFKSSEKAIMIAKYCPIIYHYNLYSAVDDAILNDYTIKVHKIPLSKAKNLKIERNDKSWYTSEYDSYMYWCKRIDDSDDSSVHKFRIMRMKSLMSFKSKEYIAKTLLDNTKEKVIIFADTQVQADRLCSNSYHSKNPNSAQNLIDFKSGKIKKLSCVLQLSEGVNIPSLRYGIIMHSYGNDNKLQQRLGRLLRLNPDDTAEVHILCYKDTIDEKWVEDALMSYDPLKIQYITHG